MSDELQSLPISKALTEPNLFSGGERKLVLSMLLLSVGIAVTGMNAPAAIAGIVIYSISIFSLRKMAKADPQMSTVYLRFIKYKLHYAPRSTPYRRNP